MNRLLELATIEELMGEVEKRFDDCVIVGRKLVDVENQTYAYRRGHRGTYESVFFLMDHARFEMNSDYHDSRRDAEPWEEL